MANENEQPGQRFSRDNLALIVGGVFILGLIFAAYTYFNQGTSIQDRIRRNADRLDDIISSNTDRDEESTETKEGEQETEEKQTPETRKEERSTTNDQSVGQEQPSTGSWVANDYQQGDISGNSYTVVSGDTLWEIAEAVYGNGAEWTRILQANSSSIGFLPNGSQALIVPGQVLVLP